MHKNIINNVLILDAGTMGLQIGLLCAVQGFDVTLYDTFDKALEQAGQRVKKIAGHLVNQGRIKQK